MLARQPDLVKWAYLEDLEPDGYYLFTDFPPDLGIFGLWVKDPLRRSGRFLDAPAFDFDEPALGPGWGRAGTAFDAVPLFDPPVGQPKVEGATGGFIDTFQPPRGDAATGRLLSPLFLLTGDLLVLKVGGGRDRQRLRVSLLVDGEPVATATGHGKDVLGRRAWDIRPFRGKSAQLEVVDVATGPWGHLLVDEVRQWVEQEPSESAVAGPR